MDINQNGSQGNAPEQQPNQQYQPINNQQFQQPAQQFNGGYVPAPGVTQKPKKPIYKRWWFWVIIVIVVLGIIGGAGSDDEKSESSATTTSSSVSEETTEETTKETTTETTTKKESKKEYKASCESIPYKSMARDPDKYTGKRVKFTGEVLQVVESSWSSSVEYRIAVTKEDWGYSADDVVYVTYTPAEGESRILEEDIVTFYGESKGLMSYNSTLGGKITIPEVEAAYIELVD